MLSAAAALDSKSGFEDSCEIFRWLDGLKRKYTLKVENVALKKLKDWKITEREVVHRSGDFFSIIAVSVEAETREIGAWTQPLLKQARAWMK